MQKYIVTGVMVLRRRMLRVALTITAGLVVSSVQTAFSGQAPERSVVVAAVGDINFAGDLGRLILSKGPGYPWRDTKGVLSAADLRFGNLESLLSLKGQVYVEKTWTIHADPRTVSALVNGGFSAVSLANNHAMDFGTEALMETINVLDENGVGHAGAGLDLEEARRPALFDVNGLRVAFLSYSNTLPKEFYAGKTSPGTAPGYEGYLRADIAAAKKVADVVIVSFHWSEEMLNHPKDYQISLSRLAIRLGASLVVGHHPHVLQGIEVYHGGLIAYSLGNFAFGSYSSKVQDGAILMVELAKTGIISAAVYPVNINNYQVAFQPRLYKGDDASRVLNDLRLFSASFGTVIKNDGDRGVILINP